MRSQQRVWARTAIWIAGVACGVGLASFVVLVPAERFMLLPDAAVPFALGGLFAAALLGAIGLVVSVVALRSERSRLAAVATVLSAVAVLPVVVFFVGGMLMLSLFG